jgi:hypothetical protein
MAATAAIHDRLHARGLPWVPAFAGMTRCIEMGV